MSMETQEHPGEGRARPSVREIHFSVDGERYETQERTLTPNEILRRFAERDPAMHYLVQIEGNRRTSFEGKGDTPIKMENGMRFQVISTGPTPVSAPA